MQEDFKESNYEDAIVTFFRDELDYETHTGSEISHDLKEPLYEEVLLESLETLNPQFPAEAIQDAVYQLKNIENGPLVQRNERFAELLQDGVDVRYREGDSDRSGKIHLIDYEHPDRNSFMLVNQWTICEKSKKRPDLILFINGLPLVVMELKSPARENTNASEAYLHLKTDMEELPSLFVYNAFCVMSDMTVSKAGTITSGEDRYMEWKSVDGERPDSPYIPYTTFFRGLFEKERLLDILKNFICFNDDGPDTFKILAGYHQYFAVKKAILSTQNAVGKTRKAGVFWHTQGSGKSLSMVFYAHSLQTALQSPTIIVITDRNDLDNQLYGQFSRCAKFLRQAPEQAESRAHLKELLANREVNGIIFTTMQKFEEAADALSDRQNIVVMADEAHRSQYGLIEKVVTKKNADGNNVVKTVVGAARTIRENLPHATFIGFTGTPIAEQDRNTREVFGDYIDIYDMTQAVEDGATRPIYYENRIVQLHLDQDILQKIDAEYDLMAQNADPYVIEKSKRELGQLDAILGAEQTIAALTDDILDHYENHRAHLLTGKAMIVAYSREIALKIYKKILELRPGWEKKVAVVMTKGNSDPEEWGKIIGNKEHKNQLAREFKDNNSELKIAIVVDMWLTGFDVPSLATMYVYKPMRGHNLMQAIARVNRVFGDKEGGLIVDYVGIASALKKAMSDYTARDRQKFGEMDIDKTALIQFQERLDICRDLLYGFDYSPFFGSDNAAKAEVISDGVDFILGKSQAERERNEQDKTQNVFVKQAHALRQAASLCGSRLNAKERYETALFEAIRIALVRFMSNGVGKKFSLTEINNQINQLLKNSIKSDGVRNLFDKNDEKISLFDPDFIKMIQQMKQKNLALELLKKLLADKISNYKRTNLVKSEKFSEILQKALNRYVNGALTNEEVIAELINLAQAIAQGQEEGIRLGLTDEELAFYDAITRPDAVKDFYTNQELIDLTRELTDMLRQSRTIDWQRKENARADMRRKVKRLLRKHKYPPEKLESALETVITQCELWVDNAPLDE